MPFLIIWFWNMPFPLKKPDPRILIPIRIRFQLRWNLWVTPNPNLTSKKAGNLPPLNLKKKLSFDKRKHRGRKRENKSHMTQYVLQVAFVDIFLQEWCFWLGLSLSLVAIEAMLIVWFSNRIPVLPPAPVSDSTTADI